MSVTKSKRRPAKSRVHRVPRMAYQQPPADAAPVLLATDGSRAAAAAIHFARLMAERGAWKPEAMTVLEPLPAPSPDMMAGGVAVPYDPAAMEGIVGRIRAQLKRTGQASWDFAVQFGRVAPTIVRQAHARGAKLIVLGLGHHGRIARLFGAETAARVCRHTDTPVLAIAPGTRELARTALAAIDFGESSVRAAREALALLAPPARLHLVHVRWPRDASATSDDWERTYDDGVVHGFARLQAELTRPGVTVTTALERGHVIETLLEEAAALKADLVAVGSHSQTVLDRMLIGFTAAELLRSAHCSVLVAPPATPA